MTSFIKHKNMRDVCFEIFEARGLNTFSGIWWNLACGRPFPIITAREVIKIKDPDNWETGKNAESFQK